jgi:CheY-like chemotaxis protein
MSSMLYVDDNEDNILLMRQLMRLRPHIDLRVATTGEVGLESASASPPQLILLDQHMPDMLGSDVISKLKDSPVTASIPVVLFSADPALAREAPGWGADTFLPKPFELKHLLEVIDQFCPESAGEVVC